MRHLPLALLVTLLFAGSAHAGDLRDFCAQRPGRATPPCILDAGHLQVEVGLADAVLLRDSGGHEDVYSYAAPALRLGLSPRFELEVSGNPFIVDKVRGAGRVSGSGDTTFGLMGALTDPDSDGFAASLLGFVNAPTASHGLGAGGWSGGTKLAIALPLTDKVSLGLTPEVDVLRNANGGGTHLGYIAVASIGRGFGPVSLGAELWGEIEDEPTGTNRYATADLTAALAIGDNLQLDAGAAFGLNHATPDAEIYVGIARRF